MAFAPSASWNSRSINHLANYPSPSLPMISSDEPEKQPFHFGMQDDSLFAFAGLWDRWKDTTGSVIESCSILTTTPNSLLADVHDRMPVILRQENYDLWLDPR